MAQVVQCRCGSRFAAQPHLAGKTVRCPTCQAPLTIPSSQSASPQAAAVPAGQPIAVTCRCGQRFRAPTSLLGKTVPCPSCRSPIQVQATPPTNNDPLGSSTGPAGSTGNDPFAGWEQFAATSPSLPMPGGNSPYASPQFAGAASLPKSRPTQTKSQMKQRYNQLSLWLGLPGIFLQIFAFLVVPIFNLPAEIGAFSWLVSMALLFGGLGYFAKSKGYYFILGALGLFGCIGLVILVVLPDRSGVAPKPGGTNLSRVLLFLMLALGAVFAFVVCLALLLPAVKAARDAARRAAEKAAQEERPNGAGQIDRVPNGTNPPGFVPPGTFPGGP